MTEVVNKNGMVFVVQTEVYSCKFLAL